jgi:general secretion pathway protein G
MKQETIVTMKRIDPFFDEEKKQRAPAFKRRSGLLHHFVKQPAPNFKSGQDGFTLVEILVVITIIGLIMGLVGPRVLNYLSESKVKAATIQIESLAGSLDLYYLDLGRYPTTAQGLAALVQRPGGAAAWNGPYLKNGNLPNDPWGHPYLYRSPSEHGPYEIVSYGSDGQEGGTGIAADIKSWERR